MRYFWIISLSIFFHVGGQAACSSGGLIVVVSKSNPTDSLSLSQLRKLMLGDVRSWPDDKAVALVMRESSSDVWKCALSAIARMSETEYRRYLANAEFRGDPVVPIKTVGSGVMAERVVAGSPGAIAVVEGTSAAAISSSVKVVRINGKEPGAAGYPL